MTFEFAVKCGRCKTKFSSFFIHFKHCPMWYCRMPWLKKDIIDPEKDIYAQVKEVFG